MSGLSTEDLHQAMKGRAAMMAAVSCVTVPKITVNIGNCHGDDNYTMVCFLGYLNAWEKLIHFSTFNTLIHLIN